MKLEKIKKKLSNLKVWKTFENILENKAFAPKARFSIIVFQRRQQVVSWSKGLKERKQSTI